MSVVIDARCVWGFLLWLFPLLAKQILAEALYIKRVILTKTVPNKFLAARMMEVT